MSLLHKSCGNVTALREIVTASRVVVTALREIVTVSRFVVTALP